MIDSDTLGGRAGEIVGMPAISGQRNHGTLTTMRCYGTWIRQMASRNAGQEKSANARAG